MIYVGIDEDGEDVLDGYACKLLKDPKLIEEIKRAIVEYFKEDSRGIIWSCIRPEITSALQDMMVNLFGKLDFSTDSELKVEILQNVMAVKQDIADKVRSAFIESAEATARSVASDAVASIMADVISELHKMRPRMESEVTP